jgi:hypothetical protein
VRRCIMITRMVTTLLCSMACAVAGAGPAGVVVDAQWNPVPDADVVLVSWTVDGWGDEVLVY